MPRARVRRLFPIAFAVSAALAPPADAFELKLPGNGALAREVVRDPDTYLVPVGPWSDGGLPTLDVSGRVVQQAWRIVIDGITTLQIMRPLAAQLTEDGFEILFQCAGQECGGFDFRFGTDVLPAPDMFVDLFDYRFLSARGPGPQYVTVLVSYTSGTAYVQIIHVGADDAAPPRIEPDAGSRPVAPPEPGQTTETEAPPDDGAAAPSTLGARLEQKGHAILSDLEFDTGSAALGKGPFASLDALATYLKANAARRVALVGHTDTVGGLDVNVALSRRRAASVLERLATKHGVPRAQLEADGMGYLAPIAPNLTPEGREANRRVEAVLLARE
ncbi:OmpA family protein [Roseovarius spongiae]|uniref:OmpA family protein n=1 Tax=Roseovarius spongiae TaxID=2320272 RepID=UPI001FE430FE|nr:OmpA family protein [Roseovarius spongiae]